MARLFGAIRNALAAGAQSAKDWLRQGTLPPGAPAGMGRDAPRRTPVARWKRATTGRLTRFGCADMCMLAASSKIFTDAAVLALAPALVPVHPRIALAEAGTVQARRSATCAGVSVADRRPRLGSRPIPQLQRQILQEIAKLYQTQSGAKRWPCCAKDGRILCLLNFEEAAKRLALAPGQRTVALG